LGANLFSALFFIVVVRTMENNDQNKHQRPSRMANVAFPKAKYGVYLAIFIIILVLLIVYKDSILRLI
jgi:hypothetical protein